MDRKRILLVEDDTNDEELTLRALRRLGGMHEVMVARDGAQALVYLFAPDRYHTRSVPDLPHVVLLDLKLPKLDGLEVLRRLRADPRTARLPVVIFTSSREHQDVSAGYDLGANSYVRKPVDVREFNDAVHSLGLYWLMLNEALPAPL